MAAGETDVDVLAVTRDMRLSRMMMVQTVEQFRFVHCVVLDLAQRMLQNVGQRQVQSGNLFLFHFAAF